MISSISKRIDEETDKKEMMMRKYQRERALIRQYQLNQLFDQWDEDGVNISNLSNRVFEKEIERRRQEQADQQVRRSRLRELKQEVKEVEKEMKKMKKTVKRSKARTW